jgi:hypothetical protein
METKNTAKAGKNQDSQVKETMAPSATPTVEATTPEATTPEAETPKAPEFKSREIIFLSGKYGIEGNRIDFKPVNGRKLTNKLVGMDPLPKVKKNAIIVATIDGVEVTKQFLEGEVIAF